MAGVFSFVCATCGKLHEGSPSFAFPAPFYYSQIPEADRASRTRLNSDFCIIDDKDRFIRVCLEVPIHGVAEPFVWGVWVSLSQNSMDRYVETWDNPDESDVYFGWFSNHLPYYPETLNLRTSVHPRKGGIRPWLEVEPTNHPLAIDFRNGITMTRAQDIAESVMHGNDG